MDIDLINLALFIFIPAFFILFICVLVGLPQVYNDEWCFYDEEESSQTTTEKPVNVAFKYSLFACCLSGFIFALAMYFKTFYLASILLIFATLWILWRYLKNE